MTTDYIMTADYIMINVFTVLLLTPDLLNHFTIIFFSIISGPIIEVVVKEGYWTNIVESSSDILTPQ